MRSGPFFKDKLNQLIELVLTFSDSVRTYKESQDENLYSKHLSLLLDEKRSDNNRVQSGLDFSSDVVDKYAKLCSYKSQEEKGYPIEVYASAIEITLKYLKQDIEIYNSAPNVSDKDKEICEKLIAHVSSLESELKQNADTAKKIENNSKTFSGSRE